MGGGASGTEATWGGGGIGGGGGVTVTGSGLGSTITGALDVVAQDLLVASPGGTPSVDGNCALKMVDATPTKAAPTSPPKRNTPAASVTRFMEATNFSGQ